MSTKTRRVRCSGAACQQKPPSKQLHHRGECVKLPGRTARYLCLDCAQAAAQAPTETSQPEQELPFDLDTTITLTPEGERALAHAQERPALGDLVEAQLAASLRPTLPAPTVQVDIGDPLDYTRFPSVEVEGWPLRKGRLSASALGEFITCPEKFRRKQILGDRDPSGGASIAGGAAHKGVEAYWRYHLATGGGIAPPSVWKEWYDSKWENELGDEPGRIEWGKDSRKEPLTKDKVRERGLIVTQAYLEHVAPLYEPVGVEEPFVVWVEGCPVPVVGTRDLLTASECVDYKFGNPKRVVDAGWRLQGLIYLLSGDKDMTWHSVGWPKADGTCTIHTPLSDPGLRFERTYERYSIANDLVRSVVQGILAYSQQFGVKEPWPANLAHSFACDMCVFRKNNSCPWWHRPIRGEDLV